MTSKTAALGVVAIMAVIIAAIITLAALDGTTAPRPRVTLTPSSSPAPAPSPSDTLSLPPSFPAPSAIPSPTPSLMLSDTCETGWLDTNDQFHQGTDTNPPDASGSDPLYRQDEFRVSFTNDQSFLQTVTKYEIVYLDASGNEIGTDQEEVNGPVLAGNTWIDTEQMNGAKTINASSCEVAAWWGLSSY